MSESQFPNPFLEISRRLDAIESLLKERILTSEAPKGLKTYMNSEEAAEYLRIAKQTLYSMTSGGRIPFIKRGKAILFRQSDLDKWMDQKNEIEKDRSV